MFDIYDRVQEHMKVAQEKGQGEMPKLIMMVGVAG